MVSSGSNPAQPQTLPLRHASRRQYLVLNLPRWATDCLNQAEPDRHRPLVLWEKQRGGMRIAALDQRAADCGLAPGESLSDARARVPDLESRQMDRPQTIHLFEAFADWHTNASPLVAVLEDHAPYGDLCLDITGVAHLFGGEARMLDTLLGRLRTRGFTVSGAIAPTIGAAWALAHLAPGWIVGEAELESALAELSILGLRLEESQIIALRQMGLKRIGQLYGRDRKALAARFGVELIRRLDQARGLIEERLSPRMPIAEHIAERRFAEPIGLIDDVLACAEDLAVRLALQLEAAGMGAQSFHLFLYLADHRVIPLSVNTAQPTREADHIARLFRYRAERFAGEYDPGFGIDIIRLGASSLSPLDGTQLNAFDTGNGGADLIHLFDRMSSRLGSRAVLRAVSVDTHIPERAVRLEPVVALGPETIPAISGLPPRPLRLLPVPESIGVVAEVPDAPPSAMTWRRVRYRFTRGSGPERIGAEWWQSGQRLTLRPSEQGPLGNTPALPANSFDPSSKVRDYYVAEDESGRRFWLFRLGLYGSGRLPCWFLHGIFA